MSKQFTKKVLAPAERLAQLLALHEQYDHTHQEMADDVLAWLASISTLPIEDRHIRVTLGGPGWAMEIAIDRIGTELAEALVSGSMIGMGVLVEPNLVMVGDGEMLFTATAEPIKGDPSYVSSLRMQIIRGQRALPRPPLMMVAQPPASEAPNAIRDHLGSLTSGYVSTGANEVRDDPGYRGGLSVTPLPRRKPRSKS